VERMAVLTVEQGVARLRELATNYAKHALNLKTVEKNADFRVAEGQLVGICLAIESLTEGGNYYREMQEAYHRAEVSQSQRLTIP
jgi:hypothetical protein